MSHPTITRTDLDMLCVNHRAAANDTDSTILWALAIRTMRDLIARFDVLAVDESHAAHAQYLVNRLCALAQDYTTQAVALASERIKDVLEAVAAGQRLDALRLL